MSNALSEEKKQQVIALGKLGWPLRRIEQATGVRRETASAYLKAAGVVIRLPRFWGKRIPPKPANEVTPDPDSKPAKEVTPDFNAAQQSRPSEAPAKPTGNSTVPRVARRSPSRCSTSDSSGSYALRIEPST